MNNLGRKMKAGLMVLGSCMLLGIAATSIAETRLTVENDGLVLTAFVSSSQNVLSTSIRIVGPDGFVFEDRIEDDVLLWIPEADLADGLYTWEVWTVTAERGAPMRPSLPAQPQFEAAGSLGAQNGQQASKTIDRAGAGIEIPLERLFDAADKSVHVESGSFEVISGFLQPVGDDDHTPLSQNREPNVFERAITALLDFMVPSAQAQFTSDVVIEKNDPAVRFNSAASTGENWAIRGSTPLWTVRDLQNNTVPLSIQPGSNHNALRISPSGWIGMGTTSPSEPLHIRTSNRTNIRLENTAEAQSWYVKNSNAGIFEIGESGALGGVFTIKPGAPGASLTIAANGRVGIGTDAPQRNLHIVGSHIRIQGSFSTWDLNPNSDGFWFNRSTPTSTGAVLKLRNTAPSNSIVVDQNGVGFGTNTPAEAVDVQRQAAAARFQLSSFTNNAAEAPQFIQRRARGTVASPQPPGAFENLGLFSFRGMTPSGNFTGSRAVIAAQTTQNWTNTANGTRILFSTTANGSTTPAVRMIIDQNGDIIVGGTVVHSSSRTLKTDIETIDLGTLLARVMELPIANWRYNRDTQSAKHIGPMAEDFYAAFGLGRDERTLAASDVAGVALGAIQGLKVEHDRRLEEKETQILSLQTQLDMLQSRLAALEIQGQIANTDREMIALVELVSSDE